MVEDVTCHDDTVEIIKPVFPGASIAPIGEDIRKGELAL
jgi:molybdopterin biosynthesis enzyme